MAKVNSYGQIKVPMMVTSSKTTFMEWVSIDGLMVEFTTANGLITKWKDKVLSLGATAEDMKETIRMIRSMVMELLSGQTAENILVIGAKENNMEKEFISKKEKRDKVSGRWEKESSGSRMLKPINDHF